MKNIEFRFYRSETVKKLAQPGVLRRQIEMLTIILLDIFVSRNAATLATY
jgi:hypothetical protein